MVARNVANRLRPIGQIDSMRWAFADRHPFDLSRGYAGLAVMSGYLHVSFPDEGWDIVARRYLNAAVPPERNCIYLSPGLWVGLSGLAFAASYLLRLSPDDAGYRGLVDRIEDAMRSRVVAIAGWLSRQERGVKVSHFDLISGLAGVGAYLLRRQEVAVPAAVLNATLGALVELTREEAGLPRWRTPPHAIAEEATLRRYPYGKLDCGLAHGIAGPLAMLALAYRSRVDVEGIAEAVERSAGRLVLYRRDDDWGASWPSAIPLAPDGTAQAASVPLTTNRCGWCYGTPGVARALWLAGQALDRSDFRDLALLGMAAVYRRLRSGRSIESPTFCHGLAGLLQLTLRFAHDTGLDMFTQAARMLTEQLLALYAPATPLGYRFLDSVTREVDQPGLLAGTSAIPMVLLAAATHAEPEWDRLFLLS